MGVLTQRVPFVAQMEVAECGAACLAMVLQHLGVAAELTQVRDACGTGRDGANAWQLKRAAESLGVQSKGRRVEPHTLASLRLPAILHWEFNHFVVLERVIRGGADVLDPAVGRRRVSFADMDRSLTGVALEFERPNRARRLRPRWPLRLATLRPLRRTIFLALGSALLVELLTMGIPLGHQLLVDHVVVGGRKGWLGAIAVFVISCALFSAGLRVFQRRTMLYLRYALKLDAETRFVKQLMALPADFFQRRSTGDLLQRVASTALVAEAYVALLSAVLDVLLILAYGALMLVYSRPLGALALLASGVRVAAVTAMRRLPEEHITAELRLRGQESSVLVETLSMTEVVKASGRHATFARRYADALVARLNAARAVRDQFALVGQVSTALAGLSQVVILSFAGLLVLRGSLSLGELAGFLTLNVLSVVPFTSLAESILTLASARPVMMRLADVRARSALAEQNVSVAPVAPVAPVACATRWDAELLRLSSVDYRYAASEPWVCQNVTFRARRGALTAIVGASGSGKSTLAKIALGLLEPESGSVELFAASGAPLPKTEPSASVIGVLQEPFFLPGSVRENLLLRAPSATVEELFRAAELACIHEEIEQLPEGYETQLDAQATRLSGGQRQRLLLARALLRPPPFLILDEPTSAIDRVMGLRILHNLCSLDIGLILITHHLETLRQADMIYVMHGGSIVQQGRYPALVLSPGPFRDLLGRPADPLREEP